MKMFYTQSCSMFVLVSCTWKLICSRKITLKIKCTEGRTTIFSNMKYLLFLVITLGKRQLPGFII